MNYLKILFTSSLVSALFFMSCNSNSNMESDAIRNELILLRSTVESLNNEAEQITYNKKLVTDFFEEVFNELNISAIDKYIGDVYIQHDPAIADGKKALKEEVEKWFEHMKPNSVEVKRVFAEKDLVFVHTKNSSGSRDISLMHVFRIEDKLIVEHWITLQPVPEVSENSNTMF